MVVQVDSILLELLVHVHHCNPEWLCLVELVSVDSDSGLVGDHSLDGVLIDNLVLGNTLDWCAYVRSWTHHLLSTTVERNLRLTFIHLHETIPMKCCHSALWTINSGCDLEYIWIHEAIFHIIIREVLSVHTDINFQCLGCWVLGDHGLDVASILLSVLEDLVTFIICESHLDLIAVSS